jgi:hypothetical protein
MSESPDMGHPLVSEPDLVHDIHCYLWQQEERGLIGAGLDGILQQEFCWTGPPDGATETPT